MCGRFTLTVDPGQLQEAFPGLQGTEHIGTHYNIAPTQPVAVVPNDGKNSLDFYVWGLIPSWSKDPQIGNRMINARAETLAEKPSYRIAYRRRRCLILADGFFEWRQEPGSQGKTPMYIQLKTRAPFAFAGLWDHWQSPDGSQIYSCTIITTKPNSLIEKIHNRMPVILPQTAYTDWLSPNDMEPKALDRYLVPYAAEEMVAYPVSRSVNNPANDTPECIQPVT
jgi:putative SOS response-associated peptidase YedK